MYQLEGSGNVEFVVKRRGKAAVITTFNTDFDDVFEVECPEAHANWSSRRDVIRVWGPEDCFLDSAPQTWGIFAFSRLGDEKDKVEDFSVSHD